MNSVHKSSNILGIPILTIISKINAIRILFFLWMIPAVREGALSTRICATFEGARPGKDYQDHF